MAAKPILKMGTPSLRLPSADWPLDRLDSAELRRLLADMRDTMIAAHGAGLAAPQIGENVRVVIFEVRENPRYPGVVVPYTELVNPELSFPDDEMEEGWEGCLSVPGMRGAVPRHRRLHYRAWTPDGERIERSVDGFHARVVQHECDHLDGILYPMRMPDMSKFGFTDVLFPDLAPYDDD